MSTLDRLELDDSVTARKSAAEVTPKAREAHTPWNPNLNRFHLKYTGNGCLGGSCCSWTTGVLGSSRHMVMKMMMTAPFWGLSLVRSALKCRTIIDESVNTSLSSRRISRWGVRITSLFKGDDQRESQVTESSRVNFLWVGAFQLKGGAPFFL